MGGNKDQKAQNSMNQQNQQLGTQYQKDFENEQKQKSSEAYDRANTAWTGANSTYQDFAANGGAKYLEGYPGVGGGGGGGGGGDDPRFGDVEGSYRNFMGPKGGVDTGRFDAFQGNLMDVAGNGGWDEASRGNVNRAIGQYQDFAEKGGLDDTAVARMRGNGVFVSTSLAFT